MSRGFPDFSGASAFPTRKLFETQVALVGVSVAGATDTEYLLQGQTLIEGGYLLIGAIATLDLFFVKMTIDGSPLGFHALPDLLSYSIGQGPYYPMVLGRYDPDELKATVLFMPGSYCGEEIKVQLFNASAAGATIDGHICYSLVD